MGERVLVIVWPLSRSVGPHSILRRVCAWWEPILQRLEIFAEKRAESRELEKLWWL